jgi:hypothetical protein
MLAQQDAKVCTLGELERCIDTRTCTLYSTYSYIIGVGNELYRCFRPIYIIHVIYVIYVIYVIFCTLWLKIRSFWWNELRKNLHIAVFQHHTFYTDRWERENEREGRERGEVEEGERARVKRMVL